MTKAYSERELAVQIVMEILEKSGKSHIILQNTLEKYQYLQKRERSFITRVSMGTIERLIEMDAIINQFSKIKVKKMKPSIRTILRCSVYQLIYMDSVPDSAVCNEAVKLTVKNKLPGLKGFVNGVLRNIARNRESIVYPKKSESVDYLSVTYSMPKWIVQMWLNAYKEEKIKSILKGFQAEKPLTVRCNTAFVSPEHFMQIMKEEGVISKAHSYLEYAFEIEGYDYLKGLKSFREGIFFVQDSSSMLVAEIAGVQKKDYIIDVCAAPGGKSLHLSEKGGEDIIIEARDLTEYKLEFIRENIERLNKKNIKVVQQDARECDVQAKEKADIVIADLPCSGLGVLGKKPDLRYRISKEQIEELVALQREILTSVHSYVKKEGTLIYSTCTISKEENEGNVEWFLKQFPEFELEAFTEQLPQQLREEEAGKGYLQLLPGIHNCDGFFIAKFKKRS